MCRWTWKLKDLKVDIKRFSSERVAIIPSRKTIRNFIPSIVPFDRAKTCRHLSTFSRQTAPSSLLFHPTHSPKRAVHITRSINNASIEPSSSFSTLTSNTYTHPNSTRTSMMEAELPPLAYVLEPRETYHGGKAIQNSQLAPASDSSSYPGNATQAITEPVQTTPQATNIPPDTANDERPEQPLTTKQASSNSREMPLGRI